MAKRYTDTNKYKKPFVRGLPGAYKLLWDYLYHDCDHAGIWIVDFEVAQLYIGHDMPVNKEEALRLFNNGEKHIIEIDGGSRWFIPSFVEFQYGELNENNRVHNSVLLELKKYGVDKKQKEKNKPLPSPLEGAKYKDKDKDMVKDIILKEEFEEIFLRWLRYKRKRGESYKDKESCQLAFDKLLKLCTGDLKLAEEIVEQSMAQNWAGLFAIKKEIRTFSGFEPQIDTSFTDEFRAKQLKI